MSEVPAPSSGRDHAQKLGKDESTKHNPKSEIVDREMNVISSREIAADVCKMV